MISKKERIRQKKYQAFRSPRDIYMPIISKHLRKKFLGSVLEPCAGDGRIIKDLIRLGNKNQHCIVDIRSLERKNWRKKGLIKKLGPDCCIKDNFLELPVFKKFDAVITNPPFKESVEITEHSLDFVNDGKSVLILQRSSWLGTQNRSKWMEKSCLNRIWVVPKRPIWEIDGVKKNSSDNVEYYWYEFVKGKRSNKDPRIKWMW